MRPLGRAAGKTSPTAVTIAGLVLGLLAAVAAACGSFLCALALWLANRLCDGLDGGLARAQGPKIQGVAVRLQTQVQEARAPN